VALITIAGIWLFVSGQRDLDRPCPASQLTRQPLSVHLVPTVFEHQSWVLVDTTGVVAGDTLYACADSLIVGVDPLDEADIAAGTDTLPIPTRWVAWMWLTHRLDAYELPERWQIIYPR